MEQREFAAGADQAIVVYSPDDTGSEIDPTVLFEAIAVDAARRAAQGMRIVALTSVALRHSAAFVARQGSGYETKAALVVAYARTGGTDAAT